MSTTPEVPKGTIEQLRERLELLLPLLGPEVEPAFQEDLKPIKEELT